MSISYGDNPPTPDPAMFAEAQDIGWLVVHVICDEPGAKVGDPSGVSFFAIVPAIPRPGERIRLQNRRHCEVKTVVWNVKHSQQNNIAMIPTVIAVAVEKPD